MTSSACLTGCLACASLRSAISCSSWDSSFSSIPTTIRSRIFSSRDVPSSQCSDKSYWTWIKRNSLEKSCPFVDDIPPQEKKKKKVKLLVKLPQHYGKDIAVLVLVKREWPADVLCIMSRGINQAAHQSGNPWLNQNQVCRGIELGHSLSVSWRCFFACQNTSDTM